VLAWFCIVLTQHAEPILVPISVAWIVALPVIDACGQFYRRVREGRHPFSADRGHFHHHFIHAGVPVGRSTAMILLLGFVLGGIGYFGIIGGRAADFHDGGLGYPAGRAYGDVGALGILHPAVFPLCVRCG
jgi:UDP-N-acetylmuramyl pentapeptide phosphotransferase/UDP-N-acetylglucosamine-1-phosphate transferase